MPRAMSGGVVQAENALDVGTQFGSPLPQLCSTAACE
jgi:hypothetical protein